jgi:hypothetical protein
MTLIAHMALFKPAEPSRDIADAEAFIDELIAGGRKVLAAYLDTAGPDLGIAPALRQHLAQSFRNPPPLVRAVARPRQ